MRQFPDEFRRLFSFERDAHQRTLASLIAAESSHRDHPDLRKAVDLAAHIATCRIMWLSRMTGSVPLPATLFPEGTPLAEIVEAFERMHAIWSRYLDELADAELERRFEYTTYTGERFADSVHNVLTQLFSHSSYHRGQIALLLRRIGAEPALTDFVFWTRQRVDGS
jgi:uncharacterized damage-inducible protein DinB